MTIQPIGYLRLYRELFDKPIWVCSTSKQKVILITLLCMANFKEKEWEFEGKKYKCKAGEFITSLESIAKNCGEDVSIQNVRTFLKKLETYQFLTSKSTNKNRLICITNWSLYQSNDVEPTSSLTSDQQATNKQPTAKEECKERKEIKKVFIPPTIEEIKAYCVERKNTVNPEKFIKYYEARNWIVKNKKMQSWKLTVVNWELNEIGKQPDISKADERIKQMVKNMGG